LLLIAGVWLTGCSKKQARLNVPPPPTLPEQQTSAAAKKSIPIPAPTLNPEPLFVETGMASWYGPPYHNRRSSNGEVYNMNALTAAHRTLPLGSVVRVTNLRTHHSAVVRITDRGPFVEGRVIDLSLAAAKQVDVWRAGLALVKLEVLETPAPINRGGRWAIQIGAFEEESAATHVRERIAQRYRAARVQQFSSPVGDWWVRVRVPADAKKRAEEIARNTRTPEGSIFLVRLD
jgi:rare lipoprotein A